MSMSVPQQLVLRCVAFKEQGQWVGVCLEFNLAAQGDTFADVRQRLDAQISTYLREALAGPDREHAGYLLRRRASLRFWLMYWLAALGHRLHLRTSTKDYESPLPLVPA
jgi:hypothetical protein